MSSTTATRWTDGRCRARQCALRGERRFRFYGLAPSASRGFSFPADPMVEGRGGFVRTETS